MRPYTVIEAEQRSPAWFQARLGRLTASDAGKMLAAIQKGEAAARRDLRTRLVVERLTGQSAEDSFVNADMERGLELEPVARTSYEFATGANVMPIGFLQSVEHMAGCSPDGVIGDMAGLVEIKCPRTARHLSYLRANGIPSEHRPQLLHQLWVSGAAFVDFVSFDALMPERLQLCIVRLERDEAEIAEYAKKALAFLKEVESELSALQTMDNPTARLRLVVGEVA
jgi:hypothetical protein